MSLLLKNLKWNSAGSWIDGDLRVGDGVIQAIGSPLKETKQDTSIFFKEHVLYPGLVNAHDHLEMNLYPLMGKPPYGNYIQWGRDIYKPRETPIKEIEKIPMNDRLLWGGVKNLISGVTTVVHHNPFYPFLQHPDFPVKVFANYAWAHSLAFEKNIRGKFPSASTTPFIVHAAEGIDELAGKEIRQLADLGLLKNNTVLIHAVGLSKSDRTEIQKAGASIVWCPSSNLFMFNQSADVTTMLSKIDVALGSDSTMTGKATLFEEMLQAVDTGHADAVTVMDMVTRKGREIFNLPGCEILEGQAADLLILPKAHDNYAENLVKASSKAVTAVLVDGELRFGEPDVLAGHGNYNDVTIGGRNKLIKGDVTALMDRLSEEVGREFFGKNPLWAMLS